MAVFNTNLVIHTGTDFEQTFVLEDDRSNSAKNLEGYTGCAKLKKFPESVAINTFNFAFSNRELGKIRISMTDANTKNLSAGKYYYDVLLNDGSAVERVIEGQVIVKKTVTRL